MSIEFVDELPPQRPSPWQRRREIREFADVLRANPGRWAKYPTVLAATSVSTRAHQIRKGALEAFPHGGFDATVREGVLYVQAKEPQ